MNHPSTVFVALSVGPEGSFVLAASLDQQTAIDAAVHEIESYTGSLLGDAGEADVALTNLSNADHEHTTEDGSLTVSIQATQLS